jgi:ribosomal protein S18 acetylase RimI-like enzyme
MTELELRELGAGDLAAAAAVLGRGMRDNPLHIRAFGAEAAAREAALTRFFLPVLRRQLPKGAVVGAFRAGRLAGVCAMVEPGRCQPSIGERMRMLPALLPGISLASLGAVLRWTSVWARNDPRITHWHLGPVAVERDLQGQGIGRSLLEEFCRRIDARGQAAYLETDKQVNVTFYERFGFRVTAQEPVLGATNWFMMRGGARDDQRGGDPSGRAA